MDLKEKGGLPLRDQNGAANCPRFSLYYNQSAEEQGGLDRL